MLVWLVKHGETLPIQEGVSKMRMWNLSDALIDRGHSVVWWSSTFSHQRKEFVSEKDNDILIKKNFILRLLNAGSYKRNISISRILHHSRLAKKFKIASQNYEKPDIIVCAYPLISLAKEVVDFSKMHNIPVIIDVRDQWPTTFYHYVPFWLKPIIKLYINYLDKVAGYIFHSSSRLTAMSLGCLSWAQNYKKTEEKLDKVFYIGFKSRKPPIADVVNEEIDFLNNFTKYILTFVYAGSFGYFYQLSLVINVAKKLQNKNFKNIHFILAGDGENFKNLKKQANNLRNVTLSGWLNKDQLHNVLKLSDVGLLPYNNYGDGILPNKPAEYFCYGLPVISSIKGELAKMIEDDQLGFNYENGREQELYESIKQISQDNLLLKRMSKNVKNIYKSKFNAEIIYKNFVHYIEEVNDNG